MPEYVEGTTQGVGCRLRVELRWPLPGRRGLGESLQDQRMSKQDLGTPRRGQVVALGWASSDTLVLLE